MLCCFFCVFNLTFCPCTASPCFPPNGWTSPFCFIKVAAGIGAACPWHDDEKEKKKKKGPSSLVLAASTAALATVALVLTKKHHRLL